MKKNKLKLIWLILITFLSFLLIQPQRINAATVLQCGTRYQESVWVDYECECGHIDYIGYGGGYHFYCCGWYYNTHCHSSPPTEGEADSEYELCWQLGEGSTAYNRCVACMELEGMWTAVGCIPQDTEGIVSTFMQIGIIMAGGVVLIMILVGSFMLTTSQGDPKKTQDAKELITSAIIGLLFIIFSVTILQFIGVSIFRLPGLG